MHALSLAEDRDRPAGHFRLIDDPPLPGPFNMAVDQVLLEECAASGQETLRLYRWRPATLSLGYFQPLSARADHQPSLELDVVRRATGGGAIVHDQELTYSLAVPLNDRWSVRHRELYDLVHGVIIECLGEWGAACRAWSDDGSSQVAPGPKSFLCFQRRSPGDLVLDGFKVCGSAQRRDRQALLQHGSILLRQSTYAPELPGVAELCGKPIDDRELGLAFVEGLARRLGKRPGAATRSDPEAPRESDWVKKRFGHPAWTGGR
jgi:lipoate-protein ligase A